MATRYAITRPLYLSLAGAEIEHSACITFTATPYVPAKIYGPPEHCYPAEGGEVEVEEIVVTVNGKSHALPDWMVDLIAAGMADDLAEEAAKQDDYYRWEAAE